MRQALDEAMKASLKNSGRSFISEKIILVYNTIHNLTTVIGF